MTTWPAWQTDPEAPRLRVRALLAAIVLAWISPMGVGVVLLALSNTLADTSEAQLNLGIAAIFCFYAPMFSWIGVLPAALLHWGALRNGYGGWATALVIGLLLGLILSSYLGTLAAIFAPPIAIFYWWVLKLFDPQALRPPPAM